MASLQYIEVNGEQRPVASMLRKGTAIAVDLSLAVAVASVGFGLVSWFVPLDDPGAKAPIGAIVAVAMIYLVWGRDRFYSPGRNIFRLQLARLPGNVPGLLGRSVSVHIDAEPPDDKRPTALSICLIAAMTIAAGVALSVGLSTTHIFRAVQEHVVTQPSLASREGRLPELASLPRALLIGKQRGFVQVSARWGEDADVLDFFLERGPRRWRVIAVEPTKSRQLGNYSLGAAPDDMPTFPR